MAQYRLKKHVMSVGALGNRIIEDHETHDETEFENVAELVEKGFLELADEDSKDDSDLTNEELFDLVDQNKFEELKALIGPIEDDELLKLVEAKDVNKIKSLIPVKEKAESKSKGKKK